MKFLAILSVLAILWVQDSVPCQESPMYYPSWMQPVAQSPFAGGGLSMPRPVSENNAYEIVRNMAGLLIDERFASVQRGKVKIQNDTKLRHVGTWFVRLQLRQPSSVWLECYIDQEGRIRELHTSEQGIQLPVEIAYWIREANRSTVQALYKDRSSNEIEKHVMALTALDMVRILGRLNCTWQIRKIHHMENGSWKMEIFSWHSRENVIVKLSTDGSLIGFSELGGTE